MNVTLLRDVSIPDLGVGQRGQTLVLPDPQAQEFIQRGLAQAAAAGATVTEIKEELAAKKRQTKPGVGPTETKDQAPAGVITSATLGTPVPPASVTPAALAVTPPTPR